MITEGFVYRISSPNSNSVYVGQSINPQKRFKQHKSSRQNPALASFLKKHPDAVLYSWPVFDMNTEEITEEQLCRDMGFNLLNCYPCGGLSIHGRTLPAEHRARISAALTGRTQSTEHRAKNSIARLGRTASESARANMSAAQKGRKHSAETRAKISIANKGGQGSKGRICSEETRVKMSASQMGHSVSEETRAKIGATKMGQGLGKAWSPARRAARG
jgi:predicted GIY-YIG superfamily endonuclease